MAEYFSNAAPRLERSQGGLAYASRPPTSSSMQSLSVGSRPAALETAAASGEAAALDVAGGAGGYEEAPPMGEGAYGTNCDDCGGGDDEGRRVYVMAGVGHETSPLTHFITAHPQLRPHHLATKDCVALSWQAMLAEHHGQSISVRSLGHMVFTCCRYLDLTFTVGDILRSKCDLRGSIFSPRMYPTVGDILSGVDDSLTSEGAKAIVGGDYKSGTTMAECLRSLRDTHVFTVPDGCTPCDTVCIHGARIKQLTSTFPLPWGVRVTGVRNKVATADACYADIFTTAGSVSRDEDLDVVRHSCSAADYASYVSVDPCAEEARVLRDNADADHKDRYTLTTALNVFLQDYVDVQNRAQGSRESVAQALSDQGVMYDVGDPSRAVVTKKGLAHLVALLKALRAKMPTYAAKDVGITLAPACEGGWQGVECALNKTYAGVAASADELCKMPFTVSVAVELDVSFDRLSYALCDLITRKYEKMRAERRQAKASC